jgi:hypothetical protein
MQENPPVNSRIPQGASHLEECRVAGYPAVRLVLRREVIMQENPPVIAH